jgi:hypothetical protein
MKKSISIGLMFLLLPSVVYADWQPVGKVTRVHSGHGKGAFCFSTEKQIEVPGCENRYGYMVSDDNRASERIYALLLTAYTSGKSVSIYTTGSCLQSRPEVDAVQLRDVDYY